MKRTITPVLLAVLFGLIAGCGEKDVPYVIDSEEITRYVREAGIAKELFRNSGLINPTPYTLPSDNATYYDSLVSVRRSIEVFLVPLKIPGMYGDSIPNDPDKIYVDHGHLGKVREGMAQVEDRFTVHVTRVYPDTTKHDTTLLLLRRYGFFLKLGTDTRPYAGWLLWGFNGYGRHRTPPLGVVLKDSSGATFRGDQGLYPDTLLSDTMFIPRVYYLRLTSMDTVDAGSRLHITAYRTSGNLPTRQLVSDFDEGGAFTRPMMRYDPVDYYDSLSYQTPANNPRLYNQMLIQMLSSQFPYRTGFVVPYRR